MKRVICLLAALAVALPAAAVGAEPAAVDRATADKLANTPRAAERATALKAAAAAGHTARLVTATRSVLDDAALTGAERERLLYDAALGLRQVRPDAAARALADELAAVAPTVMIWHGEGHHRVAIPRYEVAAAAASARSHWQRIAARDDAAGRLAGGLAAFPELTGSAAGTTLSSPALRGIADAFADASDATIARWRQDLLHGLPHNRQLDALAAAAARRLSDPALFTAVVIHADDAVALASLPDVPASLSAGDARQVLATATARDALASASLLRMAKLARGDAASLDYLFAALGNAAHGGSAAAALASLHSEPVTDRLAAVLAASDDDLTLRRCVLALRLTATERATLALSDWRQAPSASPAVAALKAEAAKWVQP